MIKFEDSQMPFEKTIHGYYRVGEKFFYKNFNAILESNITKLPISWDFHRTKFTNSINNINLNLNLNEQYKLRAEQLRDNYDYLILAFSGGSDSDNILRVFLKNNIKLDEVWSSFPKTLIEKSNYIISRDLDVTNMPSEYYLVIKPELEKLAVTHPEIKITVSDPSAQLTNEDYEDTLTLLNFPQSYMTIKRWRRLIEHTSHLTSKGKKVAIILGADKPIPHIKDNTYGILFSDKGTFLKSDIVFDELCSVEYFYWSTNFPDLPIAQGRKLWSFLLGNKKITSDLLKNQIAGNPNAFFRKTGFDEITKKICYPDWDFTKHQVGKSTFLNNVQYSKFLAPHMNNKFYQSYMHNINTINRLDPTISFNDGKSALSDIKLHYSFYSLGEINWNKF
jgi:hypothetical protein